MGHRFKYLKQKTKSTRRKYGFFFFCHCCLFGFEENAKPRNDKEEMNNSNSHIVGRCNW